MKNRSGFTLVELMVVIGVLAVLSAVSVPILNNLRGRHQFSGALRDVLMTLRQARMVAVEENESVMFSVTAGAGTYEAYVDDGGGSALGANGLPVNARNGARDAGERIVTAGIVPQGVRITGAVFGANTGFRFDQRGFPVDPNGQLTDGTITLASDLGGSRQVVLIRSGHSMIQ